MFVSERLITRLTEENRARIGNAPITTTARRLAATLNAVGLPYAVIGGYAVQRYGYPRFTADVDAIVRDREQARQALFASGLFRPIQGTQMTVADRDNGVCSRPG